MPKFPREELEEMMRRWVAANDEAGKKGNWEPMARFYTEDAIYTWNNGPDYEFVARSLDLGRPVAALDRKNRVRSAIRRIARSITDNEDVGSECTSKWDRLTRFFH